MTATRSERELRQAYLSDQIARSFRRESRVIRSTLRDFVTKPSPNPLDFAAAMRNIEDAYGWMRKDWRKFGESMIEDSWGKGTEYAVELLRKAGNKRAKELTEPGRIHELVKTSVARMDGAVNDGMRNARALLTHAQTRAKALEQGQTLEPNDQEKELSSVMLDDEKILVRNGKNYQADSYAEMTARTETRIVQSEAAKETILASGEDLVIISSHNTTTEECQEYEGRIFSLTGTNRFYPVLDTMPPFHPNCLHVLVPFVEDTTTRGIEETNG